MYNGLFGIGATELVLLLIPFLLIYFVPTIIAFSRNCPSKTGVFLLNLFLGFTFLGWIVALIWSFSSKSKTTIIVNNTQNNPKSTTSSSKPNTQENKNVDLTQKLDNIERLKKMLDDETITKEEFEKQKAIILEH